MSEEDEYRIIANYIVGLGLMCAGDPHIIAGRLAGYLFDEEEAGSIRRIIEENGYE